MATEAGALALAGIFLFIAFVALGRYFAVAPPEPLFAELAGFVGLYGARLALRTDALAAGLGQGRADFLSDAITYVIPLPLLLGTVRLVEGRWRQATRAVLAFQCLYAAVSLAADLARGRAGSGMGINNVVAVLLLVLLAGYVLAHRADWPRVLRSREGRTIVAGAGVFCAVALLENVSEILGRPLEAPEPIGLLVLVGCVADALLVRAGRREAQLSALERELSLARSIQGSLLPARPPAVPGLALAVRFVPLSAVAGDFYDFAVHGPGRASVLVADVTGHGVPAALGAAMIKAASAGGELAQPAPTLVRINRLLSSLDTGQFATAACLHLDVPAARFTYAAAGHPPLLLWRAASRHVEVVVENGLLLGLMPEAPYAETSGILAAGDRLLLYTDGVVEAADPAGVQLEQERLAGYLAAEAALEADALAGRLLERVRAWRAAPAFDDDLTLVVVAVG